MTSLVHTDMNWMNADEYIAMRQTNSDENSPTEQIASHEYTEMKYENLSDEQRWM